MKCKNCFEAKKAFVTLSRLAFETEKLGVICLDCDIIWKTKKRLIE